MKARDWAQQAIYTIINPLVQLMVKTGITPNMVTTIGLVLNAGVGALFVIGAPAYRLHNLSYVGWAGFVILFAGLFDMLDGQVARLGRMSSKFGAMYDSVLDRYSELLVLSGITYYLMYNQLFIGGCISLLALVGSIMVSYVRARAEGLGVECKEGLMQRPERVVLTGLGAMLTGLGTAWFGQPQQAIWILIGALALMALLANITAIGRLNNSRHTLNSKEQTDAR